MSKARLGSYSFRIDPSSVSLPYDVKTTDQKSVGGKVVQILGARLGDLRVAGQFGSWEEQYDFFQKIKKMGVDQGSSGSKKVPDPFRFTYPAKQWSFMVYLKAFSSADGGPRPLAWRNDIIAPRWSLTLFIDDNHAGLAKVASDVFISRLANGVGWKRSEFSAPLTDFDRTLAREEGTILTSQQTTRDAREEDSRFGGLR